MTNEYTPWVEEGIDEAEYFRRRHIELGRELAELETKVRVAQEALCWACEMFVARDEMNAKVHCSPVRFSPITERCIKAWEQVTGETYKRY